MKVGNSLPSQNSAVKSAAFVVCFVGEIVSMLTMQGQTNKSFVKLGVYMVINIDLYYKTINNKYKFYFVQSYSTKNHWAYLL